jgi:hypothetical protein
VVGSPVMPGGLDQQPPHVGVAGLGDRALDAALPRRVFAWALARDMRQCWHQ